jgi:hypothetical protein
VKSRIPAGVGVAPGLVHLARSKNSTNLELTRVWRHRVAVAATTRDSKMEKKKTGVSRQTLWQRKHRALGLCVVCSQPAYKGWRCVKHYEQHKIVMRLRYIPKVRGRYDVGGSSEFLEAAERAAKKAAARREDGQPHRATRFTARAKGEAVPTPAAPVAKKRTRAKSTPRARKASL